MKAVHFIAGLPRSGSTLLCNILNQNPRFEATGTSGILGVIVSVRNSWESSNELLATSNKEQKLETLRGALQGFHSTSEAEVVFNKSRGWTSYIELAEALVGKEPKIIVPVRDIPDILASFEKIFRKNAGIDVFPQEKAFPGDWKTLQGRMSILSRADQPFGFAYNSLKDAFDRGYKDKLHVIEYVDLTHDPETTMKSLYEFLEEEYFEHDFNNVEQIIEENDLFHGIKGLHEIKPKVKPKTSDAREILGADLVKQFSNQEFWR